VAKKRRSNHDEESPSWLYTIGGIGVIAVILAFVGFAQPARNSSIKSVELEMSKSEIAVPPEMSAKVVQKPSPVQEIMKPETMMKPEVSVPQPKVTQPNFPENVLDEPGLNVWLPFGADARDKCAQECSTPACNQNCSRLMSEDFARRILPAEIDHQKLIAKSVESCGKASFVEKISGGDAAAIKTMFVPVDYFDDEAVLPKLQEARQIFLKIIMNGTPSPLAEAACLYEGSLVSALATSRAAKKKDSLSEITFRNYESAFASKLLDKLRSLRG